MPSASVDLSPDVQLLAEVRAGSERALAHVYRCHAGPVFALARRILGDADAAADVVHAVVVRLWDGRATFDPERSSLRAFLLLEARNRCFELLRSASRPGAGHPVVHMLGLGSAADGPLEVLSEEQRQAIELAYFGGYTCRQLAWLLDVDESAVKTRIRLGLQRLRARLDEARTPLTG